MPLDSVTSPETNSPLVITSPKSTETRIGSALDGPGDSVEVITGVGASTTPTENKLDMALVGLPARSSTAPNAICTVSAVLSVGPNTSKSKF